MEIGALVRIADVPTVHPKDVGKHAVINSENAAGGYFVRILSGNYVAGPYAASELERLSDDTPTEAEHRSD